MTFSEISRRQLKNETIAILSEAKDLSKPQKFFLKNCAAKPRCSVPRLGIPQGGISKNGRCRALKNLSANLMLLSE